MDWIFSNANVLTQDPTRPRAEAVVVSDGRILAVGESRIADQARGNARRIDCRGKTLIPGFIDPHFHLLAYARGLAANPLESLHRTASLAELRSQIGRLAGELPPGTWIRGWGYHEFELAEKRHPNRRDLDPATTAHPVVLAHRSGGAHVLNSLALALLGITAETPDPPEGIIDRDLQTGEPTGLLYGMGNDLEKRLPAPDPGRLEEGIALAGRELCSLGITSLCDVSIRNDRTRWERIRDWKRRGVLRPKVRMVVGWDGFQDFLKAPFPASPGSPCVGGVKIVLHETTGKLSPEPRELNEQVFAVHRAGLQAHLHAVEETTVAAACDAVEYAIRRFPRPNHRHRIEHCSVCPPPLARRIASLGILVVTQPPFVYFNGDRYLENRPRTAGKLALPLRESRQGRSHGRGELGRPHRPVRSPDGDLRRRLPPHPTGGHAAAPGEGDTRGGPADVHDSGSPCRLRRGDAGGHRPGEGGRPSPAERRSNDRPRRGDPEDRVEMTLIDGEVVWERDCVTLTSSIRRGMKSHSGETEPS